MKKIIICLSIILTACGSDPIAKNKLPQTYVVTQKSLHSNLHFIGSVQPLQENTLTSPVDAVVESMHYHYGQLVKKGEVITILNSAELQKQYNETLTEYLKVKDSYTVAQAKFVGTKDLWKAGLITKNNYLSEKSSLAATRMALLQASQKLKEMGEKIDDPSMNKLSLLSLTQFDEINQVFETKRNLIYLRAKKEGILLEAPKSETNNSRIMVGSQIKAGQVLGIIGDLSGLSIEIDIPEVDIHKIFLGMPAQVEGVAFGGQILAGKVVAVNAQATNNLNGGLPSFHALIEVNQLTEAQQRWIKVGMSASITLMTEAQNALVIPIAALKREKGQTLVNIKNADGTISSKIITTGAAQADQVLVNSGLKEGDVLLYG